MPRIRVTGFIDIMDDEYDDSDMGPLTEEASLQYTLELGLEDVMFELVEEDDDFARNGDGG